MTNPEDTARLVRLFVFEHFRDHGVPPSLEQIMQRFSLDRTGAFEVLQALETDHHLKMLPDTQHILMAHPFSAISTPFRVFADGRSYYANCAWDAVAVHSTLDEPVRIESFCHHCAADLTIELAGGTMTRTNVPDPLVYLALPAALWWEDIVSTCSNNMLFFLSREHLDDWRAANPGEDGEALTIDKTHHLGLPIHREKLKLDYTRPTKDELLAHFASLALTGDFWQL